MGGQNTKKKHLIKSQFNVAVFFKIFLFKVHHTITFPGGRSLSLVKEFAKFVIMQLKTSFIFYVFVLYTKILEKIYIHHIIIYPMILLIYPMTKNLFTC